MRGGEKILGCGERGKLLCEVVKPPSRVQPYSQSSKRQVDGCAEQNARGRNDDKSDVAQVATPRRIRSCPRGIRVGGLATA